MNKCDMKMISNDIVKCIMQNESRNLKENKVCYKTGG